MFSPRPASPISSIGRRLSGVNSTATDDRALAASGSTIRGFSRDVAVAQDAATLSRHATEMDVMVGHMDLTLRPRC